MYIKIGEITSVGDQEKEINALDHVSLAELKKIEQCHGALLVRKYVKALRDTSLKNGNALLSFLNALKIDSMRIEDEDKMIFEGNRLLFNFLASFVSFLDVTKRKISATLGKEISDKFEQDERAQYDEKFSYRFLKRLRNFTLHYDMPFTFFKEDSEGKSIYMDRDHLLEYDGWSKVKEEIQGLDKKINVQPMIESLMVSINVLYHLFIFYFSKNLVDSINYMNEFIQKKKIQKPPYLLIAQDEESYKKGRFSLRPVDTEEFIDVYRELKNHPYIKLNQREGM